MDGPVNIPSSAVQILQTPPTGNSTQNSGQVPAALAALNNGATVKGFVFNRDSRSNPMIRTDRGDLTIRSEVFLKTGSEVTLRIEKTVNSINARLVSVDGQAIKEVIEHQSQQTQSLRNDSISKTAMQQSQPLPTNAQSTATQQAILLQSLPQGSALSKLPVPLQGLAKTLIEGSTIKLQILAPNLTGQPTTSGKATLQTQAQLQNTLTQAQISTAYSKYAGYRPQPIQTTAPQAPTGQANLPQPLTPMAFQNASIMATNITLPSAQIPSAIAPLLTASPLQTANLLAQQSPLQATPPLNSPAPLTSAPNATGNFMPAIAAGPNQLVADVVGIERGGATILHSPLGTFKLFPTPPLQVGSQVTLDFTPTLASMGEHLANQAASQPPAQSPSAWLALSRDWQSLSSLASVLQGISPAMAKQFTDRSFVQADKNLTKGMLFFLSALKTGTPRDWLGAQLTDSKDSRVQELIKRIAGEFSSMRPMTTHQPDQPWQAVFIPLMHDNEAEQLRVYWRDYDRESGGEKGKSGERFIVEATLSELGEMQFDGLVNKKNTPTSFDLAIRTHQPLEDHIKADINEIFLAAAEAARFVGKLSFYEKPEYMEHPLEEIIKARQQKANQSGDDHRSILA